MAAIARNVDDFFGAAKVGVRMTGGRVLSQMGVLMGIFCDEAKSADDMVEMVVLGISKAILMASAKARRWKTELEEVWDTGLMYAATASKFAGRFSLCSTGVSFRSGKHMCELSMLRPMHHTRVSHHGWHWQ